MARTEFLDSVRALAKETAESFGLDLCDLEHRLSGNRWMFRVILDRLEGQVTLEECENVSREFSVRLEVEDLIPHAYTLEVSSPGVERPLRHGQDYERFKGKEARLTIFQDEDETVSETLEGFLEGFDDPDVLVKVKDEEVRRIPVTRIKRAKLLFRYP